MDLDLPTPQSQLRIGTRGSPLALAQAHEVRDRLAAAWSCSQDCFDIRVIKTTGDNIQDRPLRDIGGKGLFTREFDDALLRKEIDVAVHSMKDMPTEQPDGLLINTFLQRENPADAWIARDGATLAQLPAGAKVGTSSLRRAAQILHRRPDLQIVDFRGNVETRLRKLGQGVADATLLAIAGLRRLGMVDQSAAVEIDADDMLPAIAQGVIGVEQRSGDRRSSQLLEPLQHAETAHAITAERAFLATLDGSCHTPIAGLAVVQGDQVRLKGEILSVDGTDCHSGEKSGPAEEAASIGRSLGAYLLERAGPGFLSS